MICAVTQSIPAGSGVHAFGGLLGSASTSRHTDAVTLTSAGDVTLCGATPSSPATVTLGPVPMVATLVGG